MCRTCLDLFPLRVLRGSGPEIRRTCACRKRDWDPPSTSQGRALSCPLRVASNNYESAGREGQPCMLKMPATIIVPWNTIPCSRAFTDLAESSEKTASHSRH